MRAAAKWVQPEDYLIVGSALVDALGPDGRDVDSFQRVARGLSAAA